MKKYLIDTNCFINPKNSYYRFEFAENFWQQLAHRLRTKELILLKAVYDEIIKNGNPDDKLTVWLKNQSDIKPFNVRNNPEVLNCYAQIFQYIDKSSRYNGAAFNAWAKESVADPWLIATAMQFDYPIVTLETKKNPPLNSFASNAKIPDVASHFNVSCLLLYDYMTESGFKL